MPLGPNEAEALKNFVHTPSESAAGFIRFVREIKEQSGITFGCILDKYIIPLRPGRVLSLVGRPGAGKTSLGAALVSREAIRILATGEAESRYAAHITWEQSVEEMEALYQAAIPDVVQRFTTSDIAWGRVDTAALEKSLVKRPMLPVWLFGDSLYNTDIHTPPMTIDKVYYAVKAVYETYSMRPSVMFLDYIQDIPVLNEKERTQQVGRAMRMIKRLAIQVKCPIILGVQSNQRVDEYANPIPTPRDLEWSSVIFQKSDVTAAIWRPVTTWSPEEKDMVDVGGVQYKNSPELMIVKLWKQRGEQGYGQWAIHFDPATLRIADYETHRILL